MKAVKLPEAILNADLITSCDLMGKNINVHFVNNTRTEFIYADEEVARNTLEYIYEQIKATDKTVRL